MKKNLIFLVAILILFIVSACGKEISPTPQAAKIGRVVNVSIESPHPYPNSEEGTKLVWSYTLSHPNAGSLHLYFDKLELKGQINPPTTIEKINYPCEINPEIRPDVKRKYEQLYTLWEGENWAEKFAKLERCGLLKYKEEFTQKEIFDKGYINGDFVVIRDKQGDILDILDDMPRGYGWHRTYGSDVITIELYADDSENAYGLSITQYAYGFTSELLAQESPAPEWVIEKANGYLYKKLGQDYVGKHISFDLAYTKFYGEIAKGHFGSPEKDYIVRYNYDFPYLSSDLKTVGGKFDVVISEDGKIRESYGYIPNSPHEFEISEKEVLEIARKAGMENPEKVSFQFYASVDIDPPEEKPKLPSRYDYKKDKYRDYININDNKGDYIIIVHSEEVLLIGKEYLTYIIYIDPSSGEVLGSSTKTESH